MYRTLGRLDADYKLIIASLGIQVKDISMRYTEMLPDQELSIYYEAID